LVEQRTFNPFVVGSTPAGPTKFKPRKPCAYGVFCYLNYSNLNFGELNTKIFAKLLPEFRGMESKAFQLLSLSSGDVMEYENDTNSGQISNKNDSNLGSKYAGYGIKITLKSTPIYATHTDHLGILKPSPRASKPQSGVQTMRRLAGRLCRLGWWMAAAKRPKTALALFQRQTLLQTQIAASSFSEPLSPKSSLTHLRSH
jgi:hypothetical protein